MDRDNTYKETVMGREIAIRERSIEFKKFAESCNLHNFSQRVSPESVLSMVLPRNPYTAFPPWQFDFFEDLCKKMSEEERNEHFQDMKLLYQRLLLKYSAAPELRERIPFFRRTFTLLLRSAECIGPEAVSSLIIECKEVLDVEVGDFMKIVPGKDMSVVSRCFPTQRSTGWDIRHSRTLMQGLFWKGRNVPLIQYGFPYTFDYVYFQGRLFELVCENSRAKVKGQLLRYRIRSSIRFSESMRLQLAVDLLVAIFDETHGYDLNVLDLLWRAVPFPYISSAEMSSLLQPFFRRKELLQELCDEYKERNPLFDVPEVTQPRSLLHLSRVQIRKSMRDANTIGDEAIDSLDCIPQSLRDYLKLPFHEVYFDVLQSSDDRV